MLALPRMLNDIVVSMLATEPDIEVVDSAAATGPIDADVDVVILNLEDSQRFGSLQQLLVDHPRLRIVAIAADGRRISLYEMRPHRTALGELSAAGLVALVRGATPPLESEREQTGFIHLS